jgi:hypothetical protein
MPRIVRLDNVQQFQAIQFSVDAGHVGGPVVIPSACQVQIQWTVPTGKTALSVLYGTVGAGFTPTTAIADALKTALTSGAAAVALLQQLGTDFGITAIRLRDVRTANLPLVSSATTNVPGTAASIGMPAEVAVCVTLRTAKTGQSGRGRFYIPGFSNATNAAGNVILAATITAVQNWAQGIPAIFTTNGLTMCLGLPARGLYTGDTGTVHPARVAQTVPVTQLLVRDNHWDSQRRRGLK